jgi:hypothetical protein
LGPAYSSLLEVGQGLNQNSLAGDSPISPGGRKLVNSQRGVLKVQTEEKLKSRERSLSSSPQIGSQRGIPQIGSQSFHLKIADCSALKLHKLKSMKYSPGHQLKIPTKQRLFAKVRKRKISRDSQAMSKISVGSPNVSKIPKDSPFRTDLGAKKGYPRSKFDSSQPRAILSLIKDPPPLHKMSKDMDNKTLGSLNNSRKLSFPPRANDPRSKQRDTVTIPHSPG